MAARIEDIKAVRAVVSRSIAEVKAALEATGGNVEWAIAQLSTQEDLLMRSKAAMLAGAGSTDHVAEPPPARPAPADEGDVDRVIADLVAAAHAKGFWVGAPAPESLGKLVSARPDLPTAFVRFLERCNGVDDNVGGRIWSADHRRDAIGLDDCDDPICDAAFPIGEHDDVGYFFLALGQPGAPVYFYDYSDAPPLTLISKNFESFIRDWLNNDLDLLKINLGSGQNLVNLPTASGTSSQ